VRAELTEPEGPAAARAALGLGARVPVVLAMAGSRGSFGRLPDVGRALDALERPLHGLLVAGHDTSLRRKLERLTDGSRVRTLGYVEDVRRLMAAADLLVTKAGGLTLAEAMVAEVPILAYGSLPGQERRNERFAARAGVALVARSYVELVHPLGRALGVLDLLAGRGARASFFLVGERAVQVPDAVRRMVGDGHEVASHGWSHRSLWLCGPRRTAEEIDRAHTTLAELAGREPRHFRPP